METEKTTTTQTTAEHRFNSIAEILQDPDFQQFVRKNINELIKNRQNRPEPKPGYRYKRDWYSRMRDAGQLHSDFFLSNIEDIWTKQSTLSSEVRGVITYVCDKALAETIKQYSKQSIVLNIDSPGGSIPPKF